MYIYIYIYIYILVFCEQPYEYMSSTNWMVIIFISSFMNTFFYVDYIPAFSYKSFNIWSRYLIYYRAKDFWFVIERWPKLDLNLSPLTPSKQSYMAKSWSKGSIDHKDCKSLPSQMQSASSNRTRSKIPIFLLP